MENLSKERSEEIQRFEKKYSNILVEWLTLVMEQKKNFCWQPRNNDSYQWTLYQKSNECCNKLREFEEKADKDILKTYIKYNPDARYYCYTFNYSEPAVDLTKECKS